jgi:hypothetical protein
MGGIAKEYITELGCEKYFRRVTYQALLEMLLSLSSGTYVVVTLGSLVLLEDFSKCNYSLFEDTIILKM